MNFVICHLVFAAEQAADESEQQIMDFSLVSFGEKGKKNWDIAGRSADIFANVVKLKDVVGNVYGKEENIKLTADRGDFDKTEGKVHLEQNVVITTSSGAKLVTDSLDWDRKNQRVTTKDIVNIIRENMVTTAYGATGEPDLKKVSLEKDVRVDINPATEGKGTAGDTQKKIAITCDGPLQIDYQKNIAVFSKNVKVDTQDILIYSDTMEVYFRSSDKGGASLTEKTPATMGRTIEKIIARGNVQIVRGDNASYSDEATYTASDKKITLSGNPKLIIYSTEDMNASFGN